MELIQQLLDDMTSSKRTRELSQGQKFQIAYVYSRIHQNSLESGSQASLLPDTVTAKLTSRSERTVNTDKNVYTDTVNFN